MFSVVGYSACCVWVMMIVAVFMRIRCFHGDFASVFGFAGKIDRLCFVHWFTMPGAVLSTVKFFSKLNKFIVGYFDPVNIFFDNKNK